MITSKRPTRPQLQVASDERSGPGGEGPRNTAHHLCNRIDECSRKVPLQRASRTSKDVIDRSEVSSIEEVKSLCGEMHLVSFTDLEGFRQAQVNVEEVRALSYVAAQTDGAVIGGMPVPIDVTSK